LSFSESNQKKKVNIITFEDSQVSIKELDIPLYRKLQVFKGDLESIKKELLCVEDKDTWIEIHLKDENPMYANQTIREYASDLGLTVLAIKIDRTQKKLEAKELDVVSLDELSVSDVFQRRLDVEKLENEKFIEELTLNFKKVVEKVSV